MECTILPFWENIPYKRNETVNECTITRMNITQMAHGHSKLKTKLKHQLTSFSKPSINILFTLYSDIAMPTCGTKN